MEDDHLGSIFNYQEYQESNEQLRQKLLDTVLKLETACRERDQAREQLQSIMKKLVPSTSNMFLEQHNTNNINNNLVLLQTKANSSITESNSSSQVSSPVDSIFETTVSSSPNVFVDVASAVIDCLANGKVLPQNGKFLEAVLNSGPLLQNLILADSVPTWKNPPPVNAAAIKIPPISVKDFDNFAGACSSKNMWQVTTTTTTTTGSSGLKKQRLQYF